MWRVLAPGLLLGLLGWPALAQTAGIRDPQGSRIPQVTLMCEGAGGRAFFCGGSAAPLSVRIVPAMGPDAALSVFRVMSPAGSPGMVVKATTGRIYSYQFCNTAPTARYIRFYDSAAPTTGNTPVLAGPIVVSAGACQQFSTEYGLNFPTAIGISVSGSAGDDDATPAGAGDVTGFVGYM